MSKRIRVESDGLPTGTQVFVGDEVLENVVDVRWGMDWDSCGRVVLTLEDVDVVVRQESGRWERYREQMRVEYDRHAV